MSAKNILPLIPLPIMSMGCFSFTGVDLETDLHWEGETSYGARLPYTYSYGGYYYSYHQLFLGIDEDSEVMLLSSFYFYSDSSYDYNYGGCISYLLSFEKDSSTSYQIESLDGEDAIDCTLTGRRLQCTMNGGMSFKRADYAFKATTEYDLHILHSDIVIYSPLRNLVVTMLQRQLSKMKIDFALEP